MGVQFSPPVTTHRCAIGRQNVVRQPLIGIRSRQLIAGLALAADAVHQSGVIRAVDNTLGRRGIVNRCEITPQSYVPGMMNVIVTVFWLQYMGFDFVQKLAGLLIRQTVYLHRRNVFPLEAQMGLCSDLVPVRGFVYTKGNQPARIRYP